MIEDPEIKALFQAESKERLESLQKKLQEVEEFFSSESIDALFRDAHTIKGSARMLGLHAIEETAYGIENLLDLPRKTKIPLTSEAIEQFHSLLYRLQDQVAEELGQPKKKDGEFLPEISTTRVSTNSILSLMHETNDLVLHRNRCYRILELLDETQQFMDQQAEENEKKGPHFFHNLEKKLSAARQEAYDQMYHLDRLTNSLTGQIQKLGRVPLNKLFDLFPLSVKEMAKNVEKEVSFSIKGGELVVDKKIIDEMKDPLMHLLRNAVAHGIESSTERHSQGKPLQGKISIEAQQIADHLWIEVQDDGRGFDVEKIREKIKEKGEIPSEKIAGFSEKELIAFTFVPGFTTATTISELAGRGVGMDVIKKQVEKLGGTITIESKKSQGSRFIVQLPTQVMTTSVFLIPFQHSLYGIPVEAIEKIIPLSFEKDPILSTSDLFEKIEKAFPLLTLSELLNPFSQKEEAKYCLVLKIGSQQAGLLVPDVLEEQQIVITPFPSILECFPYLSGAALLKNGEVSLILNPFYFMHTTQPLPKKTVLLVDDSSSLLLFYRQLLEKNGYTVITAVDGKEGLKKWKEHAVDVIVSDFHMPEMNGLEFLTEVRKISGCPFILLTSLNSTRMKEEALKQGASDYLIKGEQGEIELLILLQHLGEQIV